MVKVVVVGTINWDINLFVKRFAAVGEEVPIERIERVPGGKGANVAVAAARLLGRGEAAFIGALGKDDIAQKQLEILESEGVDTSLVKVVSGVESGQAYIVIYENGNNIINTLYGANLEIRPEDLEDPARKRAFEQASAVVVMDPPIETAEKAIDICHQLGVAVAWSPGTYCVLGLNRLGRDFSKLSYLVLNEVEAQNLTGLSNPLEAAENLMKKYPTLSVVVTLGSEGCALASRRGVIKAPGVPLQKLGYSVVNTVGCGDAFLGAFAAFKALGSEDAEALWMANLAGAINATKSETRGSPTMDELISLRRRVEEAGLTLEEV